MTRVRGWFRLGPWMLLALMLMMAGTLPSAAASHPMCGPDQMLPPVEIDRVAAEPATVLWQVQDLVKYSYPDGDDEDEYGDIENGLLKVVFTDIVDTGGLDDFDGYLIQARPGDDDPGTSKMFGVPDYTSDLIPRPAVVGGKVTQVLNLEPGTKYYVTVHAVNRNTVQISRSQPPQDRPAATTLLSAPFLGGLEGYFYEINGFVSLCEAGSTSECKWEWDSFNLGFWRRSVDAHEGTHFAFYDADDEAGQHYFRWLNPAYYGPFDHAAIDVINGGDHQGQADMLSLNKDGNVEAHCENNGSNDGNCGHTHYLFQAVDEEGRTVATELVETGGKFEAERDPDLYEGDKQFFQTVFTAEAGALTLSVSLGRVDESRYLAMSDTAAVTLEMPGDLRAYDQTYWEWQEVLDDLTINDTEFDENEDAQRWLGANDSGTGRSIWNPDAAQPFDQSQLADPTTAKYSRMVAHLNNQLK